MCVLPQFHLYSLVSVELIYIYIYIYGPKLYHSHFNLNYSTSNPILKIGIKDRVYGSKKPILVVGPSLLRLFLT